MHSIHRLSENQSFGAKHLLSNLIPGININLFTQFKPWTLFAMKVVDAWHQEI